MNEVINDYDLPPDPARVVEGLRDTGYNFNTAIADIVDNSIAANASKVDITINTTPDKEITLYIADNGDGMSLDGLKNAMRYGSEERKDPSSLGKFGLGLKTGSTAFCRCLSVISIDKESSEPHKVQWDLDHIAKTRKWSLKELPVSNDELDLLELTAPEQHGTLIVWEKIDRLIKTNTKKSFNSIIKTIINELTFHLSMVYQRFLDVNDERCRNVEITINTVPLKPWDPFCIKEEQTELVLDEAIDIEKTDSSEVTFFIKAYVLPRRENFSTPDAMTDAKISNDKQGFYIYRENRLIYWGDWLKIMVNEPHYSLLRVQFDFNHELDDIFNVDIKKSRILPTEEILQILDRLLGPARRVADERYRKGTNKKVANKTLDAHDASNKNIEEKAHSVEESKIIVTGNNQVQIENIHGKFEHKIDVRKSEKPGQVHIIPVESLQDGLLWNPCIVDNGKHAIELNTSHPYYQKVYYPILSQNVMVTGMDSLLWALGEAELSGYNESTKEAFEDVRAQVSRHLRKLVSDLPEPDLDEE